MAEFLKLKKSNCKNCYKCIRHCPVKSIRFSGNQANIVGNECILCGSCFVVCPQNAKEIADDTERVKVFLQSGDPVVASVAPSFIANYDGAGIQSLEKALKKLGFYSAEETAIGATIVKKEYERMLHEDKPEILISSCCHSVNLLIQKYFPEQLKYLADILSPMQAHCADIKRRIPGAKTVFIGPCIAKKDEAAHYGPTDAVLTFEELSGWLRDENIEIEKECDQNENSRARFFPTTGGILKTMDCNEEGYTYLAVDGVENCMSALRDIQNGGLKHCFIEMSACAGSCINGPVMEKYHRSPVRDYVSIASYAGKNDFEVDMPSKDELHKNFKFIDKQQRIPSESEIAAILRQMGKTKPSQELNCGSCGYNTCREKAIAVYQGKADLSMCLPFLKDRAESVSDNIIGNTPNGIIILNEDLEVQQINKAALRIMNLRQASDVIGEQVIRIMDPKDFIDAKSGAHITDKRVYLAEYKKYIEETIVYDQEFRSLMCIMRDVTVEENQRERKEEVSRKTVDIADKVVDKQMRIVQEIASLLGETAAETKIALTKLKEQVTDE
ncbi:MAG: [Fe-Fe] hydrogenase large subunit C-terminal domain-containing protein [Acutalibacteraceae bacterium]